MEIIKKYGYIIIIIIMIILVFAISLNTNKSKKYIITEQEALAMKDAVIIDVRTEAEYKEGHINGAINIPHDEINKKTITYEKNKKLIVYCRTGARSKIAVNNLVKLGFTKVYDLGGLNKWTKKLVTN